ncbi:MAG: DUF3575 domain-containing protein [Sphingobacteriia bacterium]|nr:MAG: DUF3575 domain-containing protein [Sphingobacteriia bacterium]TAG29609.1 MAG: DUF3575 domain-containing protein [Sphingobacteriia bacterium]TAH06870.1 MAG: DUF3575 domain-containing protein [Sphingobacteriia bacterium]
MKKIILLLLCFPMLIANAQKLIGGSNIIKMNLASLAARNYHFTYERHIFKSISFSISYRTMSKGPIPFQAQFEEAINSNEINFSKFEIGNTAITPELRIYLSLGKMKGFYLAPYMRFATFDLSAPIKYTSNLGSKEAVFNGKVTSTSGGLMIGYQFQLLKKLVLDFQIIGAHYGTSKGDLDFAATLNNFEQQSLRDNINKIEAEPFRFTSTVTGNGAQIKTDGPWAGIRGLNLGLGLRF